MTFYTAAITLILVMDPLGNVPVFMSILQKYSDRDRYRIILRETFIAFIALLVFLFFGRYIMHGLRITTEALSIAGGIVLFLISIRMIFPPERGAEYIKQGEEPFIVPLAIPLTAGPSAMATVMLFVTSQPSMLWSWFIAICIASAVFLLIILSGTFFMRILGRRGLLAVERLMGMILIAVSVQMFLTGISQYLKA